MSPSNLTLHRGVYWISEAGTLTETSRFISEAPTMFFSLSVRINISFLDFCHKYFLKGTISKCSDSQTTSYFVIVSFAIPVWYLLLVWFLLSAIPAWYHTANIVWCCNSSWDFSWQLQVFLTSSAREGFLRLDESEEDTFPFHARQDDILLRSLSFIKEWHLHITSDGILLPIAANQTAWLSSWTFHKLNPAAFT